MFRQLLLLCLSVCFAMSTTFAQKLPDITLPNIHGEEKNVADFGENGKMTIFKFWSSWALGCAQDLENTAQMCAELRKDIDIEIVSISVDNLKNTADVKAYVKQHNWNFEVLLDSSDIVLPYMGVSEKVLPYTVIADHKGNIIYRGVGDSRKGDDREKMKKMIKKARSRLPIVTIEELKARTDREQAMRIEKQRLRQRRHNLQYQLPDALPLVTEAQITTPMIMLPPAKKLVVKTDKPTPETPDTPQPPTVSTPEESKVILTSNTPVEEMPVSFAAPKKNTPVPLPAKKPKTLKNRSLKRGHTVTVSQPSVELDIWDEEIVDGDTISLFYNGDWIVKDYPLTKEPKRIKIIIEKGADNFLVLYAKNEGLRPTNTAALHIFYGDKRRKVTMSSDFKNCDVINFKFKE